MVPQGFDHAVNCPRGRVIGLEDTPRNGRYRRRLRMNGVRAEKKPAGTGLVGAEI